MSSIKLYFCKCYANGNVDIVVHRNLDLLKHEWSHSPKDFVGIVHSGFTRPKIQELPDFWPHLGKVFVTASIYWSLPINYQLSKESLFDLPITEKITPIYLILNGLGYTLPDNSKNLQKSISVDLEWKLVTSINELLAKSDRPKNANEIYGEICEYGIFNLRANQPVTFLKYILDKYLDGSENPLFIKVGSNYHSLDAKIDDLTDWVFELSEMRLDITDELRSKGIFGDESYVCQRENLPVKLMDFLDHYRYKYLVRKIDIQSPQELLRILPLKYLEYHISEFRFPVRVENVLNAKSITTLNQLMGFEEKEMLRWQNFGRGSLNSLCYTLIDYAERSFDSDKFNHFELNNETILDTDKNIDDIERRIDEVSNTPLKDHFTKSLLKLKDRDRLIIEHRTGVHGSVKTLQEVGEILDVTRERVRQIQSKFIKRIISSELWDDCIAIKIGQLLINRNEPLYLEMLEVEDPWFKGFINNYENLSSIIELFSENEIRVIKIHGANIITRVKQDDWLDLVSQMRKWLKDKAEEGGWTKGNIEVTFEAALREKSALELLPLLWEEFSGGLQFSGEDNDSELISFGKTAEAAISAVLHQAEKPLHYKEIAERATELLGKTVDERRAHNGAPALGAKLFGRGVYGLERLNPIPDRMCGNIRLVVEQMIYQGNLHKQWHCNEILSNLQNQFPALPPELDHYILNIVLDRSAKLTYLNRMVWARSDSGQTKDDRIDMADAFTKILEDHGSPLKGNALKEQLGKIRGVPAHLQIQPTERMILVGPDLWGLIDRDVNINEDTKNACLDALYKHLIDKQKGIHVTEVDNALQYLGIVLPDSYILLNIAQRDSRFYLARAMFLGLSEWGEDVRRLNFTQAVRKLISEMHEPLSIAEINKRIEDLTGLPIEGSVTGLLINEGAIYDPQNKVWLSDKSTK